MGERIVLGKIQSFEKKPIVTWRDWKKEPGSYLVIAIFSGGKYPSGAITFDAGQVNVRKTIDMDTAKSLIKRFKNHEGDIYLIVTKEEDGYLIELEAQPKENGFFYNLEGKNLIRRKKDIPF